MPDAPYVLNGRGVTCLVSGCSLWLMPVDTEVDVVDNRTRAVQLRAQGLTMKQIGAQLGISPQGVHKLLKTTATYHPLARVEQASRTLAEIAESTRRALADTFEMGANMARRRLAEVQADNDDRAAAVVLANAKLATDGARVVHGWADTNAAGASGRIAVGVITDLRGMKSAQVVDVEPIATSGEQPNDSSSHSKAQDSAKNEAKTE